LIDEADLLTVDQFEEAVVPLAHDAALENLPFAVISGGTTSEYLRTMDGQRTFSDTLTAAVELTRLDHPEAFDLIVKTAALGGQDWSQSPAMGKIVAEARGVPRNLQVVGSGAFEVAPRIGIDKALREASRTFSLQRKGLVAHLASSLPEHDVVVAIEHCLSTSRMNMWELRTALKDELGRAVEPDVVSKYVTTMQNAGVIEAHVDGNP
jgi:hypothetical protein